VLVLAVTAFDPDAVRQPARAARRRVGERITIAAGS